MSKTSKILLWVVLGVVLVLILSIVLTSMLSGGRTIDYSEVEQHVQAGDIDRIVVDDYNLICYKDGRVVYEATFGRTDAEVALLIQWSNDTNLNFSFTLSDALL